MKLNEIFNNPFSSYLNKISTIKYNFLETPDYKHSNEVGNFQKNLYQFSEENNLTKQEVKDLENIAKLESNFRLDPKENSKAFGYFQLTPNTIKSYSDVDVTTFRKDPKIQMDLGYKHYKETVKEKNRLKKIFRNTNLTDFQLIYGLWFAGYNNMKKYLSYGYNPSDGNIKLNQVLNRAKYVETSKN